MVCSGAALIKWDASVLDENVLGYMWLHSLLSRFLLQKQKEEFISLENKIWQVIENTYY
jgi:hypothetical protein